MANTFASTLRKRARDTQEAFELFRKSLDIEPQGVKVLPHISDKFSLLADFT